jgi:hypothetical protein
MPKKPLPKKPKRSITHGKLAVVIERKTIFAPHVYKTEALAMVAAQTLPWKVSCCSDGPGCWCRIIHPKQPILYWETPSDEADGIPTSLVIMTSGSMNKTLARHVVKTHNWQVTLLNRFPVPGLKPL